MSTIVPVNGGTIERDWKNGIEVTKCRLEVISFDISIVQILKKYVNNRNVLLSALILFFVTSKCKKLKTGLKKFFAF